MCANCGAMSSKFDVIDSGMKFSNTNNNRLVGYVGEYIETEVTFGEHDAIMDVQIDPTTPLPEGLKFENNTISGTVNSPVNCFIRVIFTDDLEEINGNTLDLTILAVAQEEAGFVPEKKEEKKKCRMSIAAASALISILSLAGAALLFTKKKKEN